MAFTQADVDRINAAIAGGAKRVRFSDGSETEFRDVSDLMRARNLAMADVAAAAGTGGSRIVRTTVGRDV